MSTPPEVWIPAFRHLKVLNEKSVFGAPTRDGTPYCRLCESEVPFPERKRHIRQHERDRVTFTRRAQRELERQRVANLRLVNRERRLAQRIGGAMTAPADTQKDEETVKDEAAAAEVLATVKEDEEQEARLDAEVIRLREVEGLNFQEIAVKLNDAQMFTARGKPWGKQTYSAYMNACRRAGKEPMKRLPPKTATPAEDLQEQATKASTKATSKKKPDPKPAARPRRSRAKAKSDA